MFCTQASAVFKHFCWCFDDLISRDKSEGRFDDGVVDLKAQRISVTRQARLALLEPYRFAAREPGPDEPPLPYAMQRYFVVDEALLRS